MVDLQALVYDTPLNGVLTIPPTTHRIDRPIEIPWGMEVVQTGATLIQDGDKPIVEQGGIWRVLAGDPHRVVLGYGLIHPDGAGLDAMAAAVDAAAQAIVDGKAFWLLTLKANRGTAHEAGAAVVDANALRILDQEIRDADNALGRARDDLGVGVAGKGVTFGFQLGAQLLFERSDIHAYRHAHVS